MVPTSVGIARQYGAIAPWYDDVMSVVPYRHWVQYLRRLLRRHNAHPRDVLDLGCGTGTVAQLLAAEGLRVTGVDVSPEMIAIAQAKAAGHDGVGDVHFVRADARSLAFAARFDLVVSLFDSLNYVLASRWLRDCFSSTYRALRPGGLFVFDLNSEYALRRNLFTQDNLSEPGTRVQHIWRARYSSRTRMCTVEMSFMLPDGRTFEEVHKERAHRHDDVLESLRIAGFSAVAAYDAYGFLPPGKRSERIFYVAAKP